VSLEGLDTSTLVEWVDLVSKRYPRLSEWSNSLLSRAPSPAKTYFIAAGSNLMHRPVDFEMARKAFDMVLSYHLSV
jgi:hypothetical protein